MTSITEAVFKGRSRRGMPTPPDSLKRSTAPLTTQFMARKAIEAVLAGGYTKCEPKLPQQALPPAPPQAEFRGYGRALTMWIAIFGVAGLLGIATSHLPGHAVHARLANPAPVVVATEEEPADLSPPAPVRPVAVASVSVHQAAPVAPPAIQPAPQPVAPQAPAIQVPVLRAQLHPVSKRPALIQNTEAVADAVMPAAETSALVADEVPAPARTAVSSSAMLSPANGPALEEVLYEGEPAQGARAVAPRAAALAVAGQARRVSAESGPGESKSSGRLKVEGIFWDKVRPMAIIAGNIVEAGSTVGPYKIAEIQQDRVILDGNGLSFELRP